jgi:hypothetical protein
MQPNWLVKRTPIFASKYWFPPCFALRCRLPRALGLMLKPPAQIDGATVVEYGCLSEPTLPAGYVPPPGGGKALEPIQNFAVCSSNGDGGFYLFCCTPDWRYMTYCYEESLQQAKNQVGVEFGQNIDLWHKANTAT